MGKIIVFSIAGCPHCRAAKSLLRRSGATYHDISLDDFPQRRKEVVVASGGAKTVPQIFFNATHVGGNTKLQELAASGELPARLAACEAEEDALGRRPKTTEEYVAEHGEHKASTPAAAEALALDEAEQAVEMLAAELRAGLDVKTRRYHLTSYRACFVGSEAVSWLMERKGLSRAAAVERLQALCRSNIIHHVTHEHGFEDGFLFYRFQEDEEQTVLNMSRIFAKEARPASAVAESIRQRILGIYNTFLHDDGHGVDYDGIGRSEAFAEYTRQTTELQTVNLSGMSLDETLAFFINIYNALVIHGHVKLGRPSSTWSRLKFFSKVAYNIGGHTFALNDIEQGILRGNRVAPGELRRRFKAGDPRLAFALPRVDPRIHFALVCGARSCPPIKLYTPDTVQEALTLATEAFLEDDSSFLVDEAKHQVTVSTIFKWYKRDFGSDPIDACHWAMLYLPRKKKAALARLLGLVEEAPVGWGSSCSGRKVALKYFPYDWGHNSSKTKAGARAGAGGGGGSGADESKDHGAAAGAGGGVTSSSGTEGVALVDRSASAVASLQPPMTDTVGRARRRAWDDAAAAGKAAEEDVSP